MKVYKKHKDDDFIAKDIIKLYEKLSASRRPLEKTWQEVNCYVRPSRESGGYDNYSNKDIYDSTAILASEYLISALWSLINSSGIKWFYLKPKSTDIQDNQELKSWFKDVNTKMHSLLGDAYSGFYYKSYEFYGDLVAFGSAVFSITEDLENKKLQFDTYHLGDVLFCETYNKIDTVIRKLQLNAKQAISFFGANNVSKEIKDAYKKDSDEMFLFLHTTIPWNYFNDNDAKLKKMKYSSYYVDVSSASIVLKSGYYEFPYMIARWQTNSNQTYGQSPAMVAMADIKMLNAMSKTMIIAAQKQVDPTMLATNEASIQGIKTAPGSIIYGGIDPLTGNQLIKPLQVNSDMANSYNLQEQRRNSVREAFYHSLLLFVYSNNATATEVLSVNEQKLRILGAKVARIQSEFLYPLLKRQYLIMERLNLFPKAPEGFDVNDIEIDFCGPWNKYQKILDTSGVHQITNLVKNIQEFDPDIINSLNWKEVLKMFAEGQGIPETLFNKIED